jgi:hypothetical protein
MEEVTKFDVSVILPIKSSKVRDFDEYFKKAIELNCEGYLAHYFFGLNELQKNNYKESVTHFLKSINKTMNMEVLIII